MQGRVDIEAGICLHKTSAVASTDDMRLVTFTMETTCDNVERLKAIVAGGEEFDAYHEIDTRVDSDIVAAGKTARVCTDCIVPVSLLKAMRVAAQLAMVKDAHIAVVEGDQPAP